MKIKNTFLVGISLLLLSSCVVKSLNPFYTKKSISFDKRFVGNWKDKNKGVWSVIAVKDELTKEKPVDSLKKEDLQFYKKYKNSYYVQRENKGRETFYLATPFKIKGETFLDFYPFETQKDRDNLLEGHIIYTHSLVKYDVQKNGEIEIRWLDEDKIEELFKERKIKIKHKKVGVLDEKYLLTASSKELEKFVEKYVKSDDKKKWDTSTKFILSKTSDTE